MKIIVTVKQVPDPDIPPIHFKVDEGARKVVPPSGVAPVMNGYETARRLRALGGDHGWIPIIFLPSNIRDQDVATGIEAGGDDYLAKPVSPVVLRAKINAMQRITDMRQRLVDLQDERRRSLRVEGPRRSWRPWLRPGDHGCGGSQTAGCHVPRQWCRSPNAVPNHRGDGGRCGRSQRNGKEPERRHKDDLETSREGKLRGISSNIG